MVLSEQDRDRLADDIYHDRRIVGSVFCGKCGYDLQTLPYIHVCPECGQEYNARPLVMKGVFVPHLSEPPIRELGVLVVCGVGAVVMLGSGMNPIDIWRLLFGLTLLGCCVLETGSAFQKTAAYFRNRGVRRRIEEREREAAGD